ncbi:hypothetical protein Glove_309g19 [Diversispora epigaea]|uniref:Uncharacterized protein n=1 Tax=Diversispora epigaea TaxID=1348612 RepID=A0A397HXX8_9GLOM|nr:hypothetical protein Glove_309g19 [Diversispora epigaea]
MSKEICTECHRELDIIHQENCWTGQTIKNSAKDDSGCRVIHRLTFEKSWKNIISKFLNNYEIKIQIRKPNNYNY